jgi:cyclopropane-fatty-acyl-phospholipid synthase
LWDTALNFEELGIVIGGTQPHAIHLNDDRVLLDLAKRGVIAIGEGYVDGRWDCEALDELACRVLTNAPRRGLWRGMAGRFAGLQQRLINRQAGRRARVVIDRHYERYAPAIEEFTGRTRCYSCAYWEDADDLDDAQIAKIDLVCRKLNLREHDRLLDIGCGYGALVDHAVRHYGCTAVGVTLSPRQAEAARMRCDSDRAVFRLVNWQSAEFDGLGCFDKIVSVGMFEHVGARNYAGFANVCARRLNPGGLMLLHTIGRSVDTNIDPWVDKYVFPGGSLPQFRDIAIFEAADMVIEDVQNIGAHYDRTLIAWERNLNAAVRSRRIDINEREHRLLRYYLLTFAGAFRARRRLQVWQILMAKHGVTGGYVRPRSQTTPTRRSDTRHPALGRGSPK